MDLGKKKKVFDQQYRRVAVVSHLERFLIVFNRLEEF